MVFLQFLGKHAHVPVPGLVTLQSIWKWFISITEMQIKREWGFATRCWTQKYAVIPSKCWKAMGNGISNKNKTKEKIYNVWLQSHKMWWNFGDPPPCSGKVSQSQVLRALFLWPSSPSDGGNTTSLAFPYGPFLHCSGTECSSFYPYLFNMDFHYRTLNVHRSSLFVRNTSKSCTEIHWISWMSPLTWLMQLCLHPSWETTFCSLTSVTLQW